MKKHLLITCSVIILLIPYKQYGQSVISIGNNRELFLDHYLIEKTENAELVLHHPHCEGPVLYFDKPGKALSAPLHRIR